MTSSFFVFSLFAVSSLFFVGSVIFLKQRNLEIQVLSKRVYSLEKSSVYLNQTLNNITNVIAANLIEQVNEAVGERSDVYDWNERLRYEVAALDLSESERDLLIIKVIGFKQERSHRSFEAQL